LPSTIVISAMASGANGCAEKPDPGRIRPDDIPVVLGDAGRLRAATGWAPAISFDRMLDDLLDYWRTRPA
jgi:nucleoside-diphosphate-sugar epimerase